MYITYDGRFLRKSINKGLWVSVFAPCGLVAAFIVRETVIQQTSRPNIPEHTHLTRRRENLKSILMRF